MYNSDYTKVVDIHHDDFEFQGEREVESKEKKTEREQFTVAKMVDVLQHINKDKDSDFCVANQEEIEKMKKSKVVKNIREFKDKYVGQIELE